MPTAEDFRSFVKFLEAVETLCRCLRLAVETVTRGKPRPTYIARCVEAMIQDAEAFGAKLTEQAFAAVAEDDGAEVAPALGDAGGLFGGFARGLTPPPGDVFPVAPVRNEGRRPTNEELVAGRPLEDEPPAPDDSAGYCAEPECTGQATDGELCRFHGGEQREREAQVEDRDTRPAPALVCNRCGRSVAGEQHGVLVQVTGMRVQVRGLERPFCRLCLNSQALRLGWTFVRWASSHLGRPCMVGRCKGEGSESSPWCADHRTAENVEYRRRIQDGQRAHYLELQAARSSGARG